MTDDIVTRLRNGDPYCIDGHVYKAWATEAAGEIERLRADRDHWHDFAACAYWNTRSVLETADGCLPSPHPLWSELNELMETVSWAEKLLSIPNRYEHNHFQQEIDNDRP